MRKLYEHFAAAWPSIEDEEGFADRMNSIRKYVVSKTLRTADWNNSAVLRGDVAAEVAAVKQQPGADILVGGSATVVRDRPDHRCSVRVEPPRIESP